MSVILRKKIIKRGQMRSLYLDIYQDGIRNRETLGFNIYTNPKTPYEKSHNKEMLIRAGIIRSKRELEIQDGVYGFTSKKNRKNDYLDYFKELLDHRAVTGVNYNTWLSVYRQLEKYAKNELKRRPKFDEIDNIWLEKFKNYLLCNLSQNSAHTYFNKIKASFYQAERDKLIQLNHAHNVESPKIVDTHREYLTESELTVLANIPFKYPELRKAFFFSAFTGLRWADIKKLKWGEIRFNDENKWHIIYTQQKTKESVTLPILQNAINLIGKKGGDNELVFKNLKYSAWHNIEIKKWVMKAGISKDITFHCARHSYATLMLSNGVDIYTVSQMLGHRNVKTTQIYAKVSNIRRVEAANSIPNINIPINA